MLAAVPGVKHTVIDPCLDCDLGEKCRQAACRREEGDQSRSTTQPG